MRTAILISGEARTFRHVYDNLRFYVLRHFPDPHFYVSVQDDAQAPDMGRMREHFPNVHIEYVKQPALPEPSAPPYQINGYGNSSPPQAILRQLWALNQVYEFMQAFDHPPADIVVRCRPDLFFRKFEVQWPRPDRPRVLLPWWGGYGGINDRFAVMTAIAARSYFTAYPRLEAMLKAGVPLHPETIMGQAVAGFACRTLRAEFCIARMPNAKGEIQLIEPDIRPGDYLDYLADLRLS